MAQTIKDEEEKNLVQSYENGEWQSLPNATELKSKYAQYARNTFQKNQRINIRISEWDLLRLKAKSLEEGIPYQTLIASLIHKYVKGKIVEPSE